MTERTDNSQSEEAPLLPADWLEEGVICGRTQRLIFELMERSAQRMGTPYLAFWLVGESFLRPVMATGELTSSFVGSFEQPLDEGLISLVFSSGQSLCAGAIQEDENHSKRLDAVLEQRTEGMVAVPVVANGDRVGILSAVHVTRAEKEAPGTFSSDDLAEGEFLSACVGKFLEAALHSQNPNTEDFQ